MPRIPTYGTDLIDSNALPGVRQSGGATAEMFADNTLGQFGKALSKVGGEMMDIATRIRRDGIEVAVTERDIAATDQIRALLHDPENGYLTQQGKNAMESRDAVIKGLDQIGRKAAEGIYDPVAKRSLERLWATHRSAALGQIESHAAREFRGYQATVTEKRAAGYASDMVLNRATEGATDPATGEAVGPYVTARATLLAAIERAAQLRGIADKDIVRDMQRDALTGVHAQVIDSFLAANNTTRAKAYFDKYVGRGEIRPDAQDDLAEKLKKHGNLNDELTVYRALAKLRGGERERLDALDRALDNGGEIAGVGDIGRVYKNVRSMLEHDGAKARDAETRGTSALIGQAQTWALQNPGKSILDWRAVHGREYVQIERKGHLAGLSAFFDRGGLPGKRDEELSTRGSLMIMSREEPEKFLELYRTTQFRDQFALGTQGIKEMQTRADEMLGNGGKFKTAFDQAVMDQALPQSLRTASTESEKAKKAAFVALQHEAQDRWRKANPGKQPTLEQQREIANSANAEWVQLNRTMPWGWNSDRKAYEVTPEMRAVPKSFYEQMRKRNATEEEIYSAWQLKQKGAHAAESFASVPKSFVARVRERDPSLTDEQILRVWKAYR